LTKIIEYLPDYLKNKTGVTLMKQNKDVLKAKQSRILLDRHQSGEINFRQFTHLLHRVIFRGKPRKEAFSTEVKRGMSMIQTDDPVLIANVINSDLIIVAKDVEDGFITKVRAIGTGEEVDMIGGAVK
jgi:hypothetical protein